MRRDYIAGLEAHPARFLVRIKSHYNGSGGQHTFDTTEAFVAHMRRDGVWGLVCVDAPTMHVHSG